MSNRCNTPNRSPWIALSERLPDWNPQSDEVLAATLTGHVVVAHPNRIQSLHADAKRTGEDCFYTHWMELPKHPDRE